MKVLGRKHITRRCGLNCLGSSVFFQMPLSVEDIGQWIPNPILKHAYLGLINAVVDGPITESMEPMARPKID